MRPLRDGANTALETTPSAQACAARVHKEDASGLRRADMGLFVNVIGAFVTKRNSSPSTAIEKAALRFRASFPQKS
jgi:hypothetical protein